MKIDFTTTPAIVNLVAEISHALGMVQSQLALDLRLRKINRIRTIQGSLAIEGNTLSESQITAIIEGKHVLAPMREIQEVKNALAAYESMNFWNPCHEQDLLHAHSLLMRALIDSAGQYRKTGVAVVSGERILHMAPPSNSVPSLMKDLFAWLQASPHHPLIASSVFHYQFEYIHPFADGNGRMGRLWQSLILQQWNPVFASLPVESIVYAHQQEYYCALQEGTKQGNASPFVEFICTMIAKSLEDISTPQVTHQVSPQVTHQVSQQVDPQVRLLLNVLENAPLDGLTGKAIQDALHLRDRVSFRKRYLTPALDAGFIERTQPDSPNSPTQRYRLTLKGKDIS